MVQTIKFEFSRKITKASETNRIKHHNSIVLAFVLHSNFGVDATHKHKTVVLRIEYPRVVYDQAFSKIVKVS